MRCNRRCSALLMYCNLQYASRGLFVSKVPLTMRIDAQVKDLATKLAQRERRSLTQYLEVLILREARKEGLMPPDERPGG